MDIVEEQLRGILSRKNEGERKKKRMKKKYDERRVEEKEIK